MADRANRAAAPAIGDQRRFYDELWHGVGASALNTHERARLDILARLLSRELPADGGRLRILEVGCGRGWLSGLLLSRFGDVVALDLSPHSIQRAREAFSEVDFRAQDIFTEPPPAGNDLVVSSEVMEHIADQAAMMRMLANAVRPSGLLLLTTPNAHWKRRWMARPETRPQPVENWLLPSELAALAAPYFDAIAQTTVFVPWYHGARAGRIMLALERHLGRLAPSRAIEGLGGGLYSVLLARRRAG